MNWELAKEFLMVLVLSAIAGSLSSVIVMLLASKRFRKRTEEWEREQREMMDGNGR